MPFLSVCSTSDGEARISPLLCKRIAVDARQGFTKILLFFTLH